MLICWHPLQTIPDGYQAKSIQKWQTQVRRNLPDSVQFVDSDDVSCTLTWYHVCEYMDLVLLYRTQSTKATYLVLVFHYQPNETELRIIKTHILPSVQKSMAILVVFSLLPVGQLTKLGLPSFQLPWGIDNISPTFESKPLTQKRHPPPLLMQDLTGLAGNAEQYFCYQIPELLESGTLVALETTHQQELYSCYGKLPLTTDQVSSYVLPNNILWSTLLVNCFQTLSKLLSQLSDITPWIFLPLLDKPDDTTSLSKRKTSTSLDEVKAQCAESTQYNGFSTRGNLKQYQPWSLVQSYQNPSKGVYLKMSDYLEWSTTFPVLKGYQIFPLMSFDFRTKAPTTGPILAKNTKGDIASGIPPFHLWNMSSEDATYIKSPSSKHTRGVLIYLSNPENIEEVMRLSKTIPIPLEIFYRSSLLTVEPSATKNTRWIDLDPLVQMDINLAHLLDPLWSLVFSKIERITYLDVGLTDADKTNTETTSKTSNTFTSGARVTNWSPLQSKAPVSSSELDTDITAKPLIAPVSSSELDTDITAKPLIAPVSSSELDTDITAKPLIAPVSSSELNTTFDWLYQDYHQALHLLPLPTTVRIASDPGAFEETIPTVGSNETILTVGSNETILTVGSNETIPTVGSNETIPTVGSNETIPRPSIIIDTPSHKNIPLYPSLFWVTRSKAWYAILISIYYLETSSTTEPPVIELVELLHQAMSLLSPESMLVDNIQIGLIGHLDNDLFIGTPMYNIKKSYLYLTEIWHQRHPPTHWIPDVSRITCVFEPKLWAFMAFSHQSTPIRV